jgi:hypothetical protein
MTRDWISMDGPKQRQRTTLLFTLRNRALVEFVVVQVAPDCRRVGSFRVRGHRGVNRVRLDNRVGRQVLGPGTYELVTRPRPNTRKVTGTRLVVVRGSSHREIRAARSAFTCSTSPSAVYKVAFGPTGTVPTQTRPPAKLQAQQETRPKRHKGVLGAKFGDVLSSADKVPIWVFVLLAVAVGLLGAAAAMPKGRTRGLSASLLAGSVGAAILLGLTIVYALG